MANTVQFLVFTGQVSFVKMPYIFYCENNMYTVSIVQVQHLAYWAMNVYCLDLHVPQKRQLYKDIKCLRLIIFSFPQVPPCCLLEEQLLQVPLIN